MKRIIAIILLLIFSLSMTVAYGEDGEGEGGGANKDKPLTLVSSSIANGQKDVSISPRITLEFNKNVVNMSVASNNKSCFSMSSESGEAVAVTAEMGDDQVDPTVKRIITVVPQSNLKSGVKYTLTISGKLKAKNGTTVGQATSISFTTAGVKESQAPTENKVAVKEISGEEKTETEKINLTTDQAIKETTEDSIEDTDENDLQLDNVKEQKVQNKDSNIGLKVFFAALIIIGIALIGVIVWRRVNGKK